MFKFPLQKVLNHRKTQEDMVQKDFQDALNELHLLVKRLTEMEALISQAHVQAYEMQTAGGPQGAGLSQINDFMKNQKIRVLAQKQLVAQQELVVEQRRDLLRAAAVETKIIAKFKDKKFEEYKKQADDDEQKEMDDQAILRFKSEEKKESA